MPSSTSTVQVRCERRQQRRLVSIAARDWDRSMGFRWQAGKRRSTRLRKGAPWLKTTLVQCAWAGARKKASYLQAQFQRLRHRRGPKKAICAVAASILTAAYHMLRDGTFYQDLGPDHFRRATPEVQANRLARQIAKLGFTCTISPAAEREVSV